MTATIRIFCTYDAPQMLRWAADINKRLRNPVASLDGMEKQLVWDGVTDIEVIPDQLHKLQVFIRVFGTHWGHTNMDDVTPLKNGETRSYSYRWYASRGYLTRS